MEKPNQNSLCRWRSRIKMLRAWFCFPLFTRAVTVYLSNYILLIGECYFCIWPIRMTLFFFERLGWLFSWCLQLHVRITAWLLPPQRSGLVWFLVGEVKVGSRLQGIGKRLNYLLVAILRLFRSSGCVPKLSFCFGIFLPSLEMKQKRTSRSMN